MERRLGTFKGFTLAEVLITVGIIGVIAELTMPTLIADYQKIQYVTGLKKAYSEISQALISLTDDYGCQGDLKCTGLFNNNQNADDFGPAFVKYFKTSKICSTEDHQGCMSSNVNPYFSGVANNGYYGDYDSGGLFNNQPAYRFITADGFSILIEATGGDGGQSCGLYLYYSQTLKVCGSLIVDVNGLKGPNYDGRDIFMFHITEKATLMPMGLKGDQIIGRPAGIPCSHPDDIGYVCGARIIEDSWQMRY